MKRILPPVLLLATAALLFALPYKSRDVGELLPVETAMLSMEGHTVVLETDLGLTGRGESLEEAVTELKEKAPGGLFLDTGNFVLLRPSAMPLLPELEEAEFLRDSCVLCLAEGNMDLTQAGDYLRAHKPGVNLGAAFSALAKGQRPEIPTLLWQDGAFALRA